MSEDNSLKTSGVTRTLDSTNYNLSQLSLPAKTIWNDYFLKLYASLPKEALSNNSNETATEQFQGQSQEGPSPVIDRITSLSDKIASQPHGSFQNKFFASETFRGMVAEAGDEQFRAVIIDRAGDKYEYLFTQDELPVTQRCDVMVGSPVVVHVGYEYRGSTKTNMLRIYLANYEKSKNDVRQRMINAKKAAWDF